MEKRAGYTAVGMALVWPAMAAADVPMFFVFALTKVSYWWSIPLVVGIEAAALKWIFGYRWNIAVRASLLVNLVSLGLGVLIYPMIGMALYPVFAPQVTEAFGTGPMVELVATALGFALVDGVVETITLIVMHSFGWPRVTPVAAVLFFLANLLTAALLVGVIYVANAPARIGAEEMDALFETYSDEIAFMDRLLEEMPAERSDELYGFSGAWVEAKRAEAEPMAFTVLSVTVPGLAFRDILRRGLMQQSSRLEAEARRDGFTVRRLTIDGHIRAWSFEKTVRGAEVFKVLAQIWER